MDTPGFQRARGVKAWLEDNCNDASQRSAAIKKFVNTHKNDASYASECELLAPLIEGAGIIYVVDGSRPYGLEYEAEMEILRWTGCPSMALINPIENEDYIEEWEKALSQYFRTVRTFNAHRAEFTKQIDLLKVFGLLVSSWTHSLNTAVELLLDERQRQEKIAAEHITNLLMDVLQYKESQKVPDGLPTRPIAEILTSKYKKTLANRERQTRRAVEQLFSHYRLNRTETELELNESELFNQERWYLFGLSKKQLTTAAIGAGASAGVIIDLGVGGSSLFLGALTGGIIGGASAWGFSERIAKLKIQGLPTGGQLLQFGPATHTNFPFVVLGRALHHYQSISQRSHANRSALVLEDSHPFALVSTKEKSQLIQIFKNISNNKNTDHQHKLLCEFILNCITIH